MLGEVIRDLPENIQNYIQTLEKKNAGQESRIQDLESSHNRLEKRVEILQEKLRLALFKKFGRSSEKIDPSQGELFSEAEEESDLLESAEEKTTTVPSYKRKKAGRKPLDPNIPREDILHDLSDEEKICGCGAVLSKIDEEIREELEIIPEQVFVKRHIYPRYACRNCEGSGDEGKPTFRSARAPARFLPGSIVSPSLLAFVLVNKFTDHLPFYRQEKRFERIGAQISRQDMSNWTINAYKTLKSLEELFVEKIKEGPFIQMDETPLQVMKERERPDTRRSYMWLARGGPPDAPLVYYRYHPTREAAFVKDFLTGYSGFLQTDGYAAYDSALKGRTDIVHVGCLAHVRRRFHDAAKATKKAGGAHIGLKKIQGIYHAEQELHKDPLEAEELLKLREKHVKPLLEDFRMWLEDKVLKIRPSSLFGKAVSYALNEWSKISQYVESPHLSPDNNAAERSIKPFVMGRKNWLFSGSPRGADASCFFYSMIETAKVNNLNPYGYLKWVFETAPVVGKAEYESLLPWNCDRESVNEFGFTSWGN